MPELITVLIFVVVGLTTKAIPADKSAGVKATRANRRDRKSGASESVELVQSNY